MLHATAWDVIDSVILIQKELLRVGWIRPQEVLHEYETQLG